MMTDQQKAQAIKTIESDVMELAKYEWIGDVLTVEGSDPGRDRWVNFFPDGDSVNFQTEEKARDHAYRHALDLKYSQAIQRTAAGIVERDTCESASYQATWESAEKLPESVVWIEADEVEQIADIYRSAAPLTMEDALLVTPYGFAAASQENADRIIERIVAASSVAAE